MDIQTNMATGYILIFCLTVLFLLGSFSIIFSIIYENNTPVVYYDNRKQNIKKETVNTSLDQLIEATEDFINE